METALAKRRRVSKAERVAPTPETAAKLTLDPLQQVLKQAWAGWRTHEAAVKRDMAERAATEIRAVFLAMCRDSLSKGMRYSRGEPGRWTVPDHLAEAHAERYLPWTRDVHRDTVDATLRLVIEREDPGLGWHERVCEALLGYWRN